MASHPFQQAEKENKAHGVPLVLPVQAAKTSVI